MMKQSDAGVHDELAAELALVVFVRFWLIRFIVVVD